ncbi:phosphotransferase [Microlunatus sp. GCM10028923]|uniref:phosphotransferase n=1 Tax=Microlunatus sp. GCM10028923 TaxID=3273400 RepID=UPI0036149C8E
MDLLSGAQLEHLHGAYELPPGTRVSVLGDGNDLNLRLDLDPFGCCGCIGRGSGIRGTPGPIWSSSGIWLGGWRAGVIDFADCGYGYFLYDRGRSWNLTRQPELQRALIQGHSPHRGRTRDGGWVSRGL